MEVKIRKQHVGLYLQEQRERSGLSQREVSKALGYSGGQFISNFERGVCFPPDEALPVLSHLYGVPLKRIVGRMVRAKKVDIKRWEKAVLGR